MEKTMARKRRKRKSVIELLLEAQQLCMRTQAISKDLLLCAAHLEHFIHT
jgi:hypothetical protein